MEKCNLGFQIWRKPEIQGSHFFQFGLISRWSVTQIQVRYQTKGIFMLYKNGLTFTYKKCILGVENDQNAWGTRPFWKMAAAATLPPVAN